MFQRLGLLPPILKCLPSRYLLPPCRCSVSNFYIPGDQNCITDALSQFTESPSQTVASIFRSSHAKNTSSTLQLDDNLLSAIKYGYLNNPFIAKLSSASSSMESIQKKNDYWFINNHLVISDIKHFHELLFHLAHDGIGHFGPRKCYHPSSTLSTGPIYVTILNRHIYLHALITNKSNQQPLNLLVHSILYPSQMTTVTQWLLTSLVLCQWTVDSIPSLW